MNLHPIARLDEAPLFAGLTNAQLRSRVEPANGIFIAESPKVIASALQAGCVPVAMLTARRHLAPQAALIDRCGDIPVYTADDETLAQLTGYALTRGVLCAMRRPQPRTMASVCRNARRIAVLENIVDATNVGALFRSAAALNMDGVLVTPSCCDPLCRRAVRVSMGTVFDIPWATAGDAPADWPTRGLAQLRAMGFRTVAMALRGDTRPLDDPALAQTDRLAIVLGTEGDGLLPQTVAQCDDTVCIPMAHGVDSLNVAAAGAVAFWALGIRGESAAGG